MIREVRRTIDFRRVAELPRRSISLAEAKEWARELTPVFRRAGSAAILRPWQALALGELLMHAGEGYGSLAVLPVGQGKTLVTYLAPALVSAQRPVLVIPAALRAKTLSDYTALYRDWDNRGQAMTIISVESLARTDAATVLESMRPDLIVIDECDVLANLRAGATRRIDRYVVQHHPVVFACTGTLTRNSIMGYWHIVRWCLRDRAPLPIAIEEANDWADALDNKRVTVGSRTGPGPLGRDVHAARAWYRDRFISTPGVLVVDQDSAAGTPLTIRVRLAPEDPELDRHFEHFAKYREILGGIPRDALTVRRDGIVNESAIKDPFSFFRIDGQLGLGFFQYWDPSAPQEWMTARRAAAAFVRSMIDASSEWSKPLDTEAQVYMRYPDHYAVKRWQAIKSTFRPNVRVKWITDSALEACVAWLAERPEPGIIWTGSTEFAERLAQRTRLPYYERKGRTSRGQSLHEARANTSIIASWHANKRGFNLQAWSRQLITLMPPSAKWVEQIIGRSHRTGAASHVGVDVLATSGGTLDNFEAMCAEARFERETIASTKKVLRAKILRATPIVNTTNRYRWARAE